MKFLFLQVIFLLVNAVYAQQCGNCKTTPSVALYDLDIQVPQPELKGEKTKGWLEWLQLFWLARHANSSLNKNNKDCIRFTQPASNDNDELKIGHTYANIPAANTNIAQYGNYFITGIVKQKGNGYIMQMQLQTSCSRKTVAVAEVPFDMNTILDKSINIAHQAASQLSPLIDKIKKFEQEEKTQNSKFALSGYDVNLIKITPSRKNLTTGQETEITLELKDCEGQPLPDKEIFFNQGTVSGFTITGTIGGIVTPAKVVTDANGKAKAKFKMTAATGKPAVINAHSLVQTPQNCSDALIGTAQIDAMPAYKVTVSFMKTGSEDLSMNSDEDGVAFQAGDQKQWDVAYSYSLLYYPANPPKDGEQIMIMPEFENNPDMPKTGTTVVLCNDGYSDYSITGKPLELIKSPVGIPPDKPKATHQRYFSSSPQLPSVSFMFNNNDLVFFSGGTEFPEPDEEGKLSSVTGSFGIATSDKKYFPLKAKKVTDPNSPYKWVYEIEYKNEEGYENQGKVFKQGKKEVETAIVQIWKSF